jgi:hypothetical protein
MEQAMQRTRVLLLTWRRSGELSPSFPVRLNFESRLENWNTGGFSVEHHCVVLLWIMDGPKNTPAAKHAHWHFAARTCDYKSQGRKKHPVKARC